MKTAVYARRGRRHQGRQTKFVRSVAAPIALILAAAATHAQSVVYVDQTAQGLNDGSSWTNAFTDLQDALDAPNREIRVAVGVYHPAQPNGDRAVSFNLLDGQKLFGGFPAGGSVSSDRDPLAYETVLSGDLNDDDGGGTGVNARWANMGENSYHVVRVENAKAELNGFTITRGWSWESSGENSAGAALFVADSQFTLARSIVEGNLAHLGPGLYNANSPSTIRNCEFVDNYAPDGRGGAIYADGDPDNPGEPVRTTITQTRFALNVATPGGGPGDAGAIWSGFDAPVDIRNCLFEQNEARWRFATGSFAANGGAILVFGAGSRIANTEFRSNRAHIGGALWLGRDTTVVNCLFIDNEAFRQSVGFNEYGGFAGAIYCAPNTTATIVGSTFHANTARSVGGVWASANTRIANSILWSNTSTEEEATLLDQQLGGDPVLFYNCIKGLLTPEPGEDPPDPANYPGAIVVDPLFVDEDGLDGVAGNADDNLHLSSNSPCIDAGANAEFPADVLTDLEGYPRLYDDPATPDTGLGAAPIVDLGAFEFGPWTLTGEGSPEGAGEGSAEGAGEGIGEGGGEGASEGVGEGEGHSNLSGCTTVASTGSTNPWAGDSLVLLALGLALALSKSTQLPKKRRVARSRD